MRPGQARKVVGLLGYPLTHSISPSFQQPAFDYLKLPVSYELWETPPEQIDAALERVRRNDCLGANVTVPHKQAVLAGLDALDDRARQIGAVNTIKNEVGRLTGYNTDADGLIRALEETGFIISGRKAVLLGAGGVARAAAFALTWAGISNLEIKARRLDQAEQLASDLAADLPGRVRAERLDGARLADDVDLIVNCTSVGLAHGPSEGSSPLPADAIPASAMVYDLVYNPPTTRLLADARRRGASTLGGLPMLIYQGAAAFEIWTGQKPPLGLMMARGEEALASQ